MTDVFIQIGPPLSYPITNGTNTVGVTPNSPGTYTLRIYDGAGVLLSESAPFVVAPNLPHVYTVSAADVLALGDASSAQLTPLSGPVDTLAFTETATVLIEFAASASDALTLSEAAVAGGSLRIVEVLNIVESATSMMTMVSSASDSMALGEAAVGNTSGAPGTLSVTFSIKNMAATSIVKPQITVGHPFGPGDVPAGYKLQLYDASGVTQNLNFQQDQESYWKQDGSLKFAGLAFVSPDTFTAGQIITYTLKAAIGAPSRTPNVSVAQLKALMVANDISWNFSGLDLGADVFQVSAQDILNTYAPYPWMPTLPTTAASTSGSNSLTLASTANVSLGMVAKGSNIPANAQVVGKTSTVVSLSANLTGPVAAGLSVVFQYPVGGYRAIKSGSVCTEYELWQYMKRQSDGAIHGYQRGQLFVRLWGTTGPIEIYTRLQRPNLYGPIPASTVGIDDRLVCNSNLTYGSSVVATWGGSADPSNISYPASSFNVAHAGVAALSTDDFPGGNAITISTTGTLPAGIQANKVYFPTGQYSLLSATTFYYWLMFERTWVWNLGGRQPTVWAANTNIGRFSVVAQNGWIYTATTPGKTAATGGGPAGTAATQTDGTVVWTLCGVAFTNSGTGTHTLNLALGTWRNTGMVGAQRDTRRVWIPASSGATQPNVLPQFDFDYWANQSRAIPCHDKSVSSSLSFMKAPLKGYTQNQPRVFGFFLAATGNSFNDERISYLNCSSANTLYNQLDPLGNQYMNIMAFCWADYYVNAYDERAAQPAVVNMGPNRSVANPGSYPNLPPVNPHLTCITVGGPYGTPSWLGQGTSYTSQDAAYSYSYACALESSHTPIPTYVPYLRTGDPIYYDILRSQAGFQVMGGYESARHQTVPPYVNSYTGGNVFAGCGGPLYDNGQAWQARSWGWLLRTMGCTWHVMPSDDPMIPYLDDTLNDSSDLVTHYAAALPTKEANVGWVPVLLPSGGGSSIEPWMETIMWICAAMEAWRGERPGWKDFLANHFIKGMPRIWDTAQGGCDGLADIQWLAVSSNPWGTTFADGFYQTPEAAMQATYINQSPPWSSATTCASFNGMARGITSQNAHQWVPYTADSQSPPPQQYFDMAIAGQAMGGVIGISLSSTLAKRMIARIAQVGPIKWSTPQGPGVQNNYVQWAIREPTSHS